ncbi:non-hydrolyzing UDP-N-acetylglucosamine 2-epimerase [Devosia algicola]
MVVFGTRPEAIKMAPVIKELNGSKFLEVIVCVSAQHRNMLDQVLNLFEIQPDFDLDLMKPSQTLESITCAIIQKISLVIDKVRPDLVLVHGDTTTAFAATLAAFYKKIAVGHVEAGLRSGDIHSPWPEEMNRRYVGQIASLHFAPTAAARDNLLAEGVAANKIWVTGNTVIDALSVVLERSSRDGRVGGVIPSIAGLQKDARIVLVTGHRRENFGDGIEAVCRALKRLAENKQVSIVYPVHPNPNVMKPVHRLLDGVKNVHLIDPMDYQSFVDLMSKSHIIITDSGGVQEEAPSLGKPVLVMRDTTERPEAVSAGTVLLVGVDENRIFDEASRLLADASYYAAMSAAHNPYGDGHAADRIARIIEGTLDVHEF